MFFSKKSRIPDQAEALPGREAAMAVPARHAVKNAPLVPPFPEGLEQAVFGMGCFWGAERKFWEIEGVYTTAAGYAGGFTPNPTYEEVCSGRTGHTEVVLVVFDPAKVSYEQLLRTFWENHDPTQGMRQGNDVGTQYRSVVYTSSEAQQKQAEASRDAYQHERQLPGRPQPLRLRPAAGRRAGARSLVRRCGGGLGGPRPGPAAPPGRR